MSKKKQSPILSCFFFLGSILMTVGIVLLCIADVPDTCGKTLVGPQDQSLCNRTLEDDYPSVTINVNDTSTKNLATYIFSKQPKRIYLDKNYSYQVSHKMYAAYYLSVAPATKVYFSISADERVDVECVGKVGRYTEVIYKKEDIRSGEGSFVIDQDYTNPHFIISGLDFFDAEFNVTVGSPGWDTSSVSYAAKCTSYPCMWVFEENAKLTGHDLYIVTENTGEKYFRVETELETNSLGYIIGGIVLIVASVGVIVLGIFLAIVFD